MKFSILLAVALVAVLSPIANAAVPPLINLQGVLRDTSGLPVADGSYSVAITMYDASSGGTALWAETSLVTTSRGLFSVQLGSLHPIPDSVFNGSDRWFGFKLGTDPELATRRQLVSIGYAYRVNSVDGAEGGIITSKISIGPGHVNTGTHAFVAGESNEVSGSYSSVGGGFDNTASGPSATVGGGQKDTASGGLSTVAGGSHNVASGISSSIGGGTNNYARGSWSVVGGGGGATSTDSNSALGDYSTISGGGNNRAPGANATVGGGRNNIARGNYSVIGGGGSSDPFDSSVASGSHSVVAGGAVNRATGNSATISGGVVNSAGGESATVSGGEFNSASGSYATVGGGKQSSASGTRATINGGFGNVAADSGATVGGGVYNRARGVYSVVGGGGGGSASDSNSAVGAYSAIGGGRINIIPATGTTATIAGGAVNTADGLESAVGGGRANRASGGQATVAGGGNNRATGANATVAGGAFNTAGGNLATVAGGGLNDASGQYAAVGGGDANTASGLWATVAGGWQNYAADSTATVGGGKQDSAFGSYSTIGGGIFNRAGRGGTVAGGLANQADSEFSAIGGGVGNHATGYYSTVSGGASNKVSGYASTVSGGSSNTAAGDHSFAAGFGAEGLHEGSFVWADRSVFSAFSSTANNQFLIRAAGGVGIGTNSPAARLHVKGAGFPGAFGFFDTDASAQDAGLRFYEAGVVKSHVYHQAATNTLNLYGESFSGISVTSIGRVGIATTAPAALLHVNGTAGNNTGVWSNLSDRRLKKDIEPMADALETVNRLQPVTFRWKDAERDAQFGRVRGLIAQDVENVIPEWVKTDPDGYKRIEPIGDVALLLGAIKEQQKQIDDLKSQVAELQAEKTQARLEP